MYVCQIYLMLSKTFTNFLIIFSKIQLHAYVVFFSKLAQVYKIFETIFVKAINKIQIFIFYNKIILPLHKTALQYIFYNAIL